MKSIKITKAQKRLNFSSINQKINTDSTSVMLSTDDIDPPIKTFRSLAESISHQEKYSIFDWLYWSISLDFFLLTTIDLINIFCHYPSSALIQSMFFLPSVSTYARGQHLYGTHLKIIGLPVHFRSQTDQLMPRSHRNIEFDSALT